MGKPPPHKKAPEEKVARLVTVGFQQEEYDMLYRHYRTTTCRSLAEYVRCVLLKKKVAVYTRSRSLDELVRELIELRRALSGLAEQWNAFEFSRCVQLLDHGSRSAAMEQRYEALQSKMEAIKETINKIADQWWHE